MFRYKPSFGQNASRMRPLFAVVLTTFISVILTWEHNLKVRGSFRDAVMDNPATTSLIKQLIASLLGTLWVYTAGSIFNLSTRLHMGGDRKPRLQTINFWAALGVQRIDFSLPMTYITVSAVIVLFGHGIGALWAGAITPVPVVANVPFHDLRVPNFTLNSPWMEDEFFDSDSPDPSRFDDSEMICSLQNRGFGYIPTCVVPGLQNLILNTANLATTFDGQPRLHSKNDNPDWSYVGRSYGVGSTPGILDSKAFTNGEASMGYNYTELGFLIDSQCSYNTTTEFHINPERHVVSPPGTNLTLKVFSAQGTLPNSTTEYTFPIILSNQTRTQGLLTWAATSDNGRGLISLAAIEFYEMYDQIQCEVTWTPTIFDVTVNYTNKNISVKSREPLARTNELDVEGYLRTNVMDSLGLIAQTSASASYATLGQSLYNNWMTYNESIKSLKRGPDLELNVTFAEDVSYGGDPSPVRALQDSLNAMLDDILIGFGAAHLAWDMGSDNFSSATDIDAQYSAVRFGDDRYIYATLAINIVLIMIAIEEAIRTRNWKNISPFDYQDFKSVVIAASAGGKDIADECHARHEYEMKWEGDPDSKEAAGIRVRLISHPTDTAQGPAVVLAGAGSDESEEKSISAGHEEDELRLLNGTS